MWQKAGPYLYVLISVMFRNPGYICHLKSFIMRQDGPFCSMFHAKDHKLRGTLHVGRAQYRCGLELLHIFTCSPHTLEITTRDIILGK